METVLRAGKHVPRYEVPNIKSEKTHAMGRPNTTSLVLRTFRDDKGTLYEDYLPSKAKVRRHESEPNDKLECNLISDHALIGTSIRSTSLVKRGAFRKQNTQGR